MTNIDKLQHSPVSKSMIATEKNVSEEIVFNESYIN